MNKNHVVACLFGMLFLFVPTNFMIKFQEVQHKHDSMTRNIGDLVTSKEEDIGTDLTTTRTKKQSTTYIERIKDRNLLNKEVNLGQTKIENYLIQHKNDGKQIVSFSLYGNNPRYTDGAIANAKLMRTIYPGWSMLVFHDNSVPENIFKILRKYGAELRDMSKQNMNAMSWRFTVSENVARFCARDIDSRLSQREKLAVDEWILSGKKFHVMRDHPSHSLHPISGGMWCASEAGIRQIQRILFTLPSGNQYMQDMDWLNTYLWPIVKKSVLQHDSFSCDRFGGGLPFPTARVGWEHVGSIYIDGKMKESNVNILAKTSQPAMCTRQIDSVVQAKKDETERVCFPYASGSIPERKGQIKDHTIFSLALTTLMSRLELPRVIEIGTWYGGGSTQAFVDGIKGKADCTRNSTHQCCMSFIVTFEIFEPAWNHARLYHQHNPVWLVLGTTVGMDQMLKPEEIPKNERGEHYRLYYERDRLIMQKNNPQLSDFCRRILPDVVLVDGNEYTVWGEFQIVMSECRPKYLALHDTGTLKTKKVENYIQQRPQKFSLVQSGTDTASWAIYKCVHSQSNQNDWKLIVWSNDFHISTIGNVKKILQPKGVKFIDKSLSGHCHVTKTCASDLKVLTRENGISPSTDVKRRFIQSYEHDMDMKTVDAVMCFHPSAMCELFMSFQKRLFVIATTRYEMGRETAVSWLSWNHNLKMIASDPQNVVAANNMYDARYIEYFTGIEPVVIPSWIHMKERYTGTSNDILVAPIHSEGAQAIWKSLKQTSVRFKDMKTKYTYYSYHQLCENTAIVHFPYQVSVMSLFEQYGMGIPILAPSPNFLWSLHNELDLVTERTWQRIRSGNRPKRSPIKGVFEIPDPNNDISRDAFMYWVQFSDYYQWPHIILFDSWDDLAQKIQKVEWKHVSAGMLSYHQWALKNSTNIWDKIVNHKKGTSLKWYHTQIPEYKTKKRDIEIPFKPTNTNIVIVVPSTPQRMCKNGLNLAKMSINTQTIQPARVILGMSVSKNITADQQNCLHKFQHALNAPLTISIGIGKETAGASRNLALEKVGEDEGVILHDDDEYIHPQAVSFTQVSFQNNPKDEILLMSYVYQWHANIQSSQTPWCLRPNFTNLFTTTNLEAEKKSTNIYIKSQVPSPECSRIHHGYPAFRSSPLRRFGIKYNENMKRGQDGKYLQDLIKTGAMTRFTCFPIVAYRSHYPTSTSLDKQDCSCWSGFAQCEKRYSVWS